MFGARIDERGRLEAIKFNRDPPIPHYKPGVLHPNAEDPEPNVRSVYAFRKNQWLEKERALYLSDPSRPLTGYERPPQPAEHENRDAVVQVVEDGNYDTFGFTLARMDYSDDEEWEKYVQEADELIQRTLANYEGGERIVDKVMLLIADDRETLEHEDLLQALAYHHALLEEGNVEPGVQTSMILVADKPAIDSLLHPTEGEKPWVWAADLTHGFGCERYDIPHVDFTSDEYPGFFRVTLEAAYAELWPFLMSVPPALGFMGVTGARMWNPEFSVWDGI